MEFRPLSPDEIAKNCISGDDFHNPYLKHVQGIEKKNVNGKVSYTKTGHGNKFTNKNFGQSLNIKNKHHFKNHIVNTLINKDTLAFNAENGRKLYYNEKSNTFIVQNDKSPKACTAYRFEKESEKSFEKTLNNEAKRMGILPSKVRELLKKGGYFALHKRIEKKHRASKQLKKNIKYKPIRQNKREERKLVNTNKNAKQKEIVANKELKKNQQSKEDVQNKYKAEQLLKRQEKQKEFERKKLEDKIKVEERLRKQQIEKSEVTNKELQEKKLAEKEKQREELRARREQKIKSDREKQKIKESKEQDRRRRLEEQRKQQEIADEQKRREKEKQKEEEHQQELLKRMKSNKEIGGY